MSHKKRTAKAAPAKVSVSKKMEVKDNSPYVFQRDKLGFDLIVRELPWTQKQKDIIDLINHKETKIVFISGPAGTSKSILATYCALKLLADKEIIDFDEDRQAAMVSNLMVVLCGDSETKPVINTGTLNQ